MKAIYDVSAPAKLNLFLHITGRRADGYHLLQSVFMLIDWCDTLHFETRPNGQISRSDVLAANPNSTIERLPPNDLTVRAATALQAATGCTKGVHISIKKNIPIQAGMGGGSSDAASTLLALNRLWSLDLPLPMLAKIGLRLGADVPFFLGGGNAWIEGIGEQVTPVTLPDANFLVVKPDSGIETARIFSHAELKRNTATAIISGFAANPFEFGSNDLQSVAQGLCPGVLQAVEWLESRGLHGRMTGSGSAVFAHLKDSRLADSLAQLQTDVQSELGNLPFSGRVCSNLQTHPLSGWARSEV